MRFALFFSALLASGAFAFDSEEWLGKRELLGHEAERLRGAYLEHSRLISAPAENIAVPIETYSDGTIKSSISAKRAQLFLDTGFVWGEDVTVRQFSKGGAVESEVKAGEVHHRPQHPLGLGGGTRGRKARECRVERRRNLLFFFRRIR